MRDTLNVKNNQINNINEYLKRPKTVTERYTQLFQSIYASFSFNLSANLSDSCRQTESGYRSSRHMKFNIKIYTYPHKFYAGK